MQSYYLARKWNQASFWKQTLQCGAEWSSNMACSSSAELRKNILCESWKNRRILAKLPGFCPWAGDAAHGLSPCRWLPCMVLPPWPCFLWSMFFRCGPFQPSPFIELDLSKRSSPHCCWLPPSCSGQEVGASDARLPLPSPHPSMLLQGHPQSLPTHRRAAHNQ